MELRAGDAQARFDLERGARLASLTSRGVDLVLAEGAEPFGIGSFVMAPWAGRIRDARAHHDGRTLALEPWTDGHAIHGLVHALPWRETAPGTCVVDVTEGWFAPVRVEQSAVLASDALTVVHTLEALEVPVPATLGWHPWFPRTLGGAEVALHLEAASLHERDASGVPSGRQVAVDGPIGAGPWDDAFAGPRWPARLTWPGVLARDIASDAAVAVVYTEPAHTLCGEPQTGPPDEVHLAPRLVVPGEPLTLTTTLRWRWADAA